MHVHQHVYCNTFAVDVDNAIGMLIIIMMLLLGRRVVLDGVKAELLLRLKCVEEDWRRLVHDQHLSQKYQGCR
tara:strand:- start:38 stop:256 length:219 start_codon:yes stop_codon:yes gene_type:complete